MPPGFVSMPPPGMQNQPVYAQPPQYAQMQMPSQQRPVVRGGRPDDQKVVRQETPVNLPAPEQLGIKPPQAPADPESIDWNAVHAYTKSIGALSFETTFTPETGYRCTIVMPTAQAGQTYRLEGAGPNEREAVAVCLDKTYRWLKQIP